MAYRCCSTAANHSGLSSGKAPTIDLYVPQASLFQYRWTSSLSSFTSEDPELSTALSKSHAGGFTESGPKGSLDLRCIMPGQRHLLSPTAQLFAQRLIVDQRSHRVQ